MLRSLLILGALSCSVAAQTSVLYSMNETGQVALNGTKIDAMPSDFDPDKVVGSQSDERWWDMAISGEDRYALRLDGRVHKNGVLDFELSAPSGTAWIAITVTDSGDVYTLRTDGRLARNDTALVEFPTDTFNCALIEGTTTFGFVDLIAIGDDVYALRLDGKIYKNTTITPVFELDAKDGLVNDCDGEAEAPDTEWRRLTVHPVDGRIFALRTDGSVVSADPSALAGDGEVNDGTIEAELPFGNSILLDRYYRDIAFVAIGDWYALRADGDLYGSESLIDPLVDYPGTPAGGGFEETYFDLATSDTSVFALRFDGRVYRDFTTDLVFKLKQSRWRRLAASDVAPNTDNIDNTRPTITVYSPRYTQGDTVSIPLVTQDIDQPTEDLAITVDESTLPPWLEYDVATRTFQSNGAYPTIPTEIDGDDTKGGVKVKYIVDDGKDKPVKGTLKFKVLTADTNVDKNKKPIGAKIKKAIAFVGVPFELRMIASDRDGDDVTITVDEEKLPEGATFDGVDTITWDSPTLDDLGKVSFLFFLDDGSGSKLVKRKVGVKVVASLLGI